MSSDKKTFKDMTEYFSIYRRYSIMICVLQPNALMPIVGRPIAVMP